MKNEEIVVQELFLNRYKINLEKIQECNTKTPYFEYVKNNKRIFVIELKTLKRIRPSKETGYKKEKSGWWSKKDTNASKVAYLLKKAHPQLEKYNNPKILTYLNETNDYDFLDLTSALTGKLTFYDKNNPADQETCDLYKYIANGDIKEKKNDIDLYIWIDIFNNYEIKFLSTNAIGNNLYNHFF